MVLYVSFGRSEKGIVAVLGVYLRYLPTCVVTNERRPSSRAKRNTSCHKQYSETSFYPVLLSFLPLFPVPSCALEEVVLFSYGHPSRPSFHAQSLCGRPHMPLLRSSSASLIRGFSIAHTPRYYPCGRYHCAGQMRRTDMTCSR